MYEKLTVQFAFFGWFSFSVICSCNSVALNQNKVIFLPQKRLLALHHAEVVQSKCLQYACAVLSHLIFKWLSVHPSGSQSYSKNTWGLSLSYCPANSKK